MDDPSVLSSRNVWLAARVCSVISNWTGLPVFCWITVARSRIWPPTHTSLTRSRTRSQPLSLLSMARLNKARSRLRCSSWSRTRIAHTSFGLRGRFWSTRRPLFHGVRAKRGSGWLPVSMIVSSKTSPVLRSAGPRLTRDTIIYRRRLRLKKADLRVPFRSCSPDAHCGHSYASPGSSEEGGLRAFARSVWLSRPLRRFRTFALNDTAIR
jgi:hypothetical protein